MSAGLSVALVLLAEGVAYGPNAPVPPKPVVKAAAQDSCAAQQASASQREIVICAQRPNGYRLNPDVMEAKRAAHEAILHGPRPSEWRHPQNDCATVGPMGCRGGATINILAAAMTAAEMAKRLSEGKEIGSMFMTDPQPDEYHRYLDAKQQRETREAAAQTAAIVAAARAEQATSTTAAQAPTKP